MSRSFWSTWSLVLGLLVASSDALASGPVVLNRATAAELGSIDGVDGATAERIVSWRDARGRVNSVEELRALGLSEDVLASLRRGTVVEVRVPEAATQAYTTVEEVLAQFKGEPGVQQLQQWIMAYTSTNPEVVQRWLAASKNFALLPQLQVEVKVKDGWDQDWQYYPADGIIDTVEDADSVFDVLDDAGRDRDVTYTARAVWDLDKLVMSSERIRVINEAQDIVKLRDNILSDATSIYFDRRQLQVEMLLSPKSDLKGRMKDQLKLMELTAQLDALSGGQFSASLPAVPPGQ